MSELFDAVDALIASASPLPPPEERKRLRQAHGLTLDQVAGALKVRRATVSGWEAGRTEPRPPEREAYARLLEKLAVLYPAPADAPSPGKGTTASETVPGPTAQEPPAPRSPSTGPAPEAEAAVTAAAPTHPRTSR
ncbi:helix-turn-helix domain-containing protein, partial [Streptomyces sp. ISL-36]|uniref:helix-turn-helix domain-containing protein n=1 Tax=Streptomyces sp. ISL-36 TaxID=2819182 RepID=UPI001BE7A447